MLITASSTFEIITVAEFTPICANYLLGVGVNMDLYFVVPEIREIGKGSVTTSHGLTMFGVVTPVSIRCRNNATSTRKTGCLVEER